MNRRLFFLLLFASLSWQLPAAAAKLVSGGVSDYVIVVAEDAIPAEHTAAETLQRYLTQMTGAVLPISAEYRPGGRHILVGRSPEIHRRLGEGGWPEGDDAVVLKMDGGDLIVSGARPRGTLYAVYTLLEDHWGVRWWSSTEEDVPLRETLELPDDLDYAYAPPFLSRETYAGEVNRNPEFAAKLKSNGHFQEIPEALGGHQRLLGWCHSMEHLLPAECHFAAHPEWYALDDAGKRNGTQPCWSNPGMIEALTRAVLEELRANPGTRIITVSQNDGWLFCRCPDCRAVEAAEGSPSGVIIRAVNRVAEAVEAEFPEVLVDTIAYVYSQKPPAIVRPRRNVMIRLCAYQNDFSQPFDSEANAAFRADFLAWRRIAAQLSIWNYVTNFSNYLIPHPNLANLGNDIRFFAANKVVSVFEQGDIGSGVCGDFIQMRSWVITHLLWNPALDEYQLMREFLHGYYSPAAGEKLFEILALADREFRRSGRTLGCYHGDVNGWFSREALEEALALFDQAEASLAGEAAERRPVFAERLRRARLPYELALLLRPEASAWNPDLSDAGYTANLARWEQVKATLEHYGVTNLGEIAAIGELYEQMPVRLAGPKLLRRSGDVPDFCRNLDADRWLEFSSDSFQLAKEELWVFRVEDSRSPFGHGVRMPGDHNQWAVSLPIPEQLADRWSVYISARAEGARPDEVVALFGVYDPTNRRDRPRNYRLAELSGAYHWIPLGEVEVTPSMYVYAAPVPDSGLTDLYIDRIVLVREAQ